MSRSHADFVRWADKLSFETQVTFLGVNREQNRYTHKGKIGDMNIGVLLTVIADDRNKSEEKLVGLYLRVYTDGETIPVTYTLSIPSHKNKDGVDKLTTREYRNNSEVCNQYQGSKSLMTTDLFFDPKLGYCLDGEVVVVAKITLHRAPKRKFALCSGYLPIEKMLFNENTSDFLICVGDEKLPVDKIILSLNSPVFVAMFTANMSERTSNTLTITDFPAKAVEAMIRCIYDPSHMYDLLALGHKYGMESMVECACDYLRHTVDVNSVVSAITHAELYTCVELKKHCIAFMKHNIKELTEDGDFISKLGTQLSAELMRAVAGVA